jgi:hypothetical protein
MKRRFSESQKSPSFRDFSFVTPSVELHGPNPRRYSLGGREEKKGGVMKVLSVVSIAALVVFTGCATQERVSTMEGRGTTQIYSASFDQVWRAAVDASQRDGLEIITADRSSGPPNDSCAYVR